MKFVELVSKVSSAAVDDMRAATSSSFAKKSSVYLSGYTSGFFAHFPRLASHLANLATKLLLRPVLALCVSCVVLLMGSTNVSAQPASLYDIEVTSIDGEKKSLRAYEGKVLLIVNVASRCGFTSQYEGLQKLYESNKDKGLVVLGFPSNDFGGQEPGTESEIKAFCSKTFGVSFPMFSKVAVLGGARHPLYQFLTASTGGTDVRWNFEKFLVDTKGKVIGRFGSATSPSDPELAAALSKALGAG